MELEKPCGKCCDRLSGQDRFLSWLYGNAAGRLLLRPLVSPWFSKAGGYLLQTRLSALAVGPYVRVNGIDLSISRRRKFDSFNDFFTRELRDGARPVENDPKVWVSPCDARLTVYPISKQGRFSIKHTNYTLAQLLDDDRLAAHYMGGTLWLYRLCVDDYHRYIYPVSGEKSVNRLVPGAFHTVNPIAAQAEPIYKMNTREYCLIRTKTFGTVLMMEVGAMLVGRIENREIGPCAVRRGAEKGNFAFGGSTIVVLSQADQVLPKERILSASEKGIETKVRMGEAVGCKKYKSRCVKQSSETKKDGLL